ncbi:MAG: hypothetical protein IJY25_01755 [Bacilli bacterium]|nr:hypothetical protein [Bacilli bacterium]
MNFNTDGFNERSNYIHNSNDRNRLAKMGPSNIDNSFGKMRSEERRNLVETTNTDAIITQEEVRGSRDNFLLRNNNMRNANAKPTMNNPVSNALNRNMFKK